MTKYDNSGVIFKNDRKEKPSHADYQGNATINGVEFWISCWVKDGQKGKFFSLAFKPKQERAAEIRSAYDNVKPQPMDDDLDSIPF